MCEINPPVLSKVKMSPSHLAALLGVLGSELQLDKRRLFLLGELGSSTESKSKRERQRVHKTERLMRGSENVSKRRNILYTVLNATAFEIHVIAPINVYTDRTAFLAK